MSKSQDGDHTLLRRYRDGDEAAAKAFYDRYSDRILLAARLQIARRFTVRFDHFDVLQTVMRNYLGQAKHGTIPNRDVDVWIHLRRLTRSKVINLVDYHTTARRDLDLSLSDPELVSALQARSEHDAVELADLIEIALQALSPSVAATFRLLLAGRTDDEICNDLNVTERTVRRHRAAITDYFARLQT